MPFEVDGRSVVGAATFTSLYILLAGYAMATLRGDLLLAATSYMAITGFVAALTGRINLKLYRVTGMTLWAAIATWLVHWGSSYVALMLRMWSGELGRPSMTQAVVYLLPQSVTSKASSTPDPVAVIALCALIGLAEEIVFTNVGYVWFSEWLGPRGKVWAAILTALVFAAYHSYAYMQVSPFNLLVNPQLWGKGIVLGFSPFVTELMKIALFEAELRSGGGLLGVTLGHAFSDALIMMMMLGMI